MVIFDDKMEEGFEKALAKQVVLADADGFVLDNWGYVYDPDELVAIFMSTQKQMQDGVLRFDFGQISEFAFSLVGTEMTVACRRIFSPTGGCMVVVVVPAGTAHNIIVGTVARAHAKYAQNRLTVLKKA